MKRTLLFLSLICLLLSPAAQAAQPIDIRVHEATRVEGGFYGVMDAFPAYAGDFDALPPFAIGLSGFDLRALDLSGHEEALLHGVFDTLTVWPDALPGRFDPAKIMALGKDPGLGVRALHATGLDGRGVSIGIIDGPLLLDHREFADASILYYDEISGGLGFDENMAFHGNAVASLAIGNNTGVAPGANLYYVASRIVDAQGSMTYTYYAEAIHRLLDINGQLAEGEKIRAISISASPGSDKSAPGHEEAVAAFERARDEGVIIFASNMYSFYQVPFISGAGRDPLADPNDKSAYTMGSWEKADYAGHKDGILFPMDCRTLAHWADEEAYSWIYMGGWSWIMPYAAGLYALCAQADPGMTYEAFLEALTATADTVVVDNLGEKVPILLVDPAGLVAAFQE